MWLLLGTCKLTSTGGVGDSPNNVVPFQDDSMKAPRGPLQDLVSIYGQLGELPASLRECMSFLGWWVFKGSQKDNHQFGGLPEEKTMDQSMTASRVGL